MKKTVFTAIISIYLTIATVAAVVFGWLYFGGLKNDGVSFNAKALVERVYNDLGFNKAVLNTGSTSADSLEYQDFESGDIMEMVLASKEATSSFYNPWTAKYHLSLVKSALGTLSNDFDQDGIYKSQVSYIQDENGYYRDTYYIKLTITDNSVLASLYFNNEIRGDANFTNPEFDPTKTSNIFRIEVKQTTGLGWELATYQYDNSSIEGNNSMFAAKFSAAADTKGKLYQMGMMSFEFKNPSTQITEPKVSGTTKLNSFLLIEANSQTKKKILVDQRPDYGQELDIKDQDMIDRAEKETLKIALAVEEMPDLTQKSGIFEKDYADKVFQDCWIDEGGNVEKLS